MEIYPKNQSEFDRDFDNEDLCRNYLVAIRWPDGFICPHCQQKNGKEILPGLFKCGTCRSRVSVTAGTLFQDTRSPLRTWFQAIWYVTGQKNGASALGLQRILGFGSYHTAWAWLHRIRRAMVRPNRESLSGVVQVDETYWGSEQSGKRGRGSEGKTLLFIAVEHTGNRIGRIRVQIVPDASAESLRSVIRQNIDEGSTVETDGWRSYSFLSNEGYQHQVISSGEDAIEAQLPKVHLVTSLLKRWLLGTHQGGVQISHLEYYLDEFTFRFNRRTSHSRGKLFFRIIEAAVEKDPLTEEQLKGKRKTIPEPHI
jgi:transposase-like protein